MQNYELTLVLSPNATPAKKKSVNELLANLAKTFKGKVAKSEDWGKVELAYPIKKNISSNFLHFVLELDSKGAKALGEKVRMEEGIVRYLLVRQE